MGSARSAVAAARSVGGRRSVEISETRKNQCGESLLFREAVIGQFVDEWSVHHQQEPFVALANRQAHTEIRLVPDATDGGWGVAVRVGRLGDRVPGAHGDVDTRREVGRGLDAVAWRGVL